MTEEFKKACKEINHIFFQELNMGPQSEETLKQWGITGKETYSELRQLARDYADHIKT